jgi:hypothetical protein
MRWEKEKNKLVGLTYEECLLLKCNSSSYGYSHLVAEEFSEERQYVMFVHHLPSVYGAAIIRGIKLPDDFNRQAQLLDKVEQRVIWRDFRDEEEEINVINSGNKI